MPYKLVKNGKRFFVENTLTGKKYSNKPIPKSNAQSQLKILQMHSRQELGGDLNNVDVDKLDGAGFADFLKKAYNKISSTLYSSASTVGKTINSFINGRNDYPPEERKLIEDLGNKKIIGITIYREPLDSTVNTMVNTISLGKFNDIKNKYSIDELYHLFMVLTLEGSIPVLIEKNEVINIHIYPKIKNSAIKFPVVLPPNFDVTLKELLDLGKDYMGNDYFTYDALTNNCQRFIMSLLNTQPELIKANPGINKFVVQDTTGLTRDLSPLSKNIFSGITNLAARFNVLAKGHGFNPLLHKGF